MAIDAVFSNLLFSIFGCELLNTWSPQLIFSFLLPILLKQFLLNSTALLVLISPVPILVLTQIFIVEYVDKDTGADGKALYI